MSGNSFGKLIQFNENNKTTTQLSNDEHYYKNNLAWNLQIIKILPELFIL